jgi:murein DD-endopeptidase MepM/ murein hydrolase activator NlpD
MAIGDFNSSFKFFSPPTSSNIVTQSFGVRPEYYEQFGLPGHEGVDFRANTGEKIMAVAPGVVADVHPVESGSNYGIYVRVRHAGSYETTYAHLEEVLVDIGEPVTAGSIIGLADSTGNSNGSHLHLTLKYFGGGPTLYPFNIVDPTPFMYR